jgi:parallel beta-helix repeat protein
MTGITDSQIIGNHCSEATAGAAIRLGGTTYTVIARNTVENSNFGIITYDVNGYNIIVENDVRAIATFTARISARGIYDIVRNNIGYNPVGNIATPFRNVATYTFGGYEGTAAGPTVANQDYICRQIDCIVDITGGTGVNVTLKDPSGNVISTIGATPIHALWVPARFILNFGNFSVAPTVVVSGN